MTKFVWYNAENNEIMLFNKNTNSVINHHQSLLGYRGAFVYWIFLGEL